MYSKPSIYWASIYRVFDWPYLKSFFQMTSFLYNLVWTPKFTVQLSFSQETW